MIFNQITLPHVFSGWLDPLAAEFKEPDSLLPVSFAWPSHETSSGLQKAGPSIWHSPGFSQLTAEIRRSWILALKQPVTRASPLSLALTLPGVASLFLLLPLKVYGCRWHCSHYPYVDTGRGMYLHFLTRLAFLPSPSLSPAWLLQQPFCSNSIHAFSVLLLFPVQF